MLKKPAHDKVQLDNLVDRTIRETDYFKMVGTDILRVNGHLHEVRERSAA